MSDDGDRQARPWGLDRAAVTGLQYQRIACNVNQPGIGAEVSVTTGLCGTPWTRCGTNVLLGRRSRQGDR